MTTARRPRGGRHRRTALRWPPHDRLAHRAQPRRLPAAGGLRLRPQGRPRARGWPPLHVDAGRRALVPAGQRPAGAGAAAARPRRRAVAERAADPRGPPRRAGRRPAARGAQHAPVHGRARRHPGARGPARPARRPRAAAARRAAGAPGRRWSCAATTPGRRDARTRRCWPAPRPTTRPCRSPTRRSRSRSTTPRAPRGSPRACSTPTAGPTSTRCRSASWRGLQPESTYLWTLPMFHCNGWCFPWAVTAVGATHVTIRARRPRRGLAADRRGGRDALQRRPDRAAVRGQPPARPSRGAARDRAGGRGAAVADPLRPHGRAEPARSCTCTG